MFSGSATVDATEAITGADTTMLDRLVSKSLIVRREARGRTRLEMLETIREYAAERFASLPDQEAVRERHYRYFLALSQRHANQRAVLGPKRLEHLAVLDDEVDNVHAALAWSARQSDGGLLLLELCEAFSEYWMMRERFAEAMEWIETALATPAAARHPALRVSLLRHKAWASWPLGRAAEQRALMAEAQRGAEAAADPALLAAVLADRAVQESFAGDLDTASAYADMAADMAESHAEASGDRWAGAFAAWAKALAARSPAELRERVSQAAELLQAVGNAYQFAELHAWAGIARCCSEQIRMRSSTAPRQCHSSEDSAPRINGCTYRATSVPQRS